MLPGRLGAVLTSSMAQELMPLSAGCNYAAANPAKELYTYDASAEALQIVERIMRVNVLPQNFVVRAADCANAVATTADGQRYILYSTAFLENFKKKRTPNGRPTACSPTKWDIT
ncbi:MAG: hypothetical protein H6574_17380 [Lewinellaceae bacterium]|nr:hypothetical protein [Lewinellaceae bacterium]